MDEELDQFGGNDVQGLEGRMPSNITSCAYSEKPELKLKRLCQDLS